MAKTKPASKKDNAPKIGSEILVNVVLDRSGSMMPTRHETINAYNAYINKLKEEAGKTKYFVSLTQFDKPSGLPELTVTYIDKLVSELNDLTAEQYQPRGYTPLYDAIGETIVRVEQRVNGRPVLNVIITDGQENSSTAFTQGTIKELIKKKEAEGWTFVFLGADIDSYSVASTIGVSHKNVSNYAKGSEYAVASSLASATMSYTENRKVSGVRGQMTSEAFFTPAMRASMGDPTTSGLSGAGDPASSSLSGGAASTIPNVFQNTTAPQQQWNTVVQPGAEPGSPFRPAWSVVVDPRGGSPESGSDQKDSL